MKTTEDKLKEIIAAGLVDGLGEPRPGELCIEAAICLALGEPHSDRPSCVHAADRKFGIEINDAKWSSPRSRAEALLPLALAQLGTAGQDRSQWVKLLAENIIRRVVPMALRAAANRQENETRRNALRHAATRCEEEGTPEAASAAHDDAARSSFTVAIPSYAYVKLAANAAYAANSACADDAACAGDTAYAVARSATSAAAEAAYAAAALSLHAAAAYRRDEVLRAAVECALDAYAKDQS